MTSLTKCLQKAGKNLTVREKDEVKKLQQNYILDGLNPIEAATQAINDTMDNLESTYQEIATQITAQNGAAPATVVDKQQAKQIVTDAKAKRKEAEKAKAAKEKEAEQKAKAEEKRESDTKAKIKRKRKAKEKFTLARATKLAKLVKARGMRYAMNRMRRLPTMRPFTEKQIKQWLADNRPNITVKLGQLKQPVGNTPTDPVPNAADYFNDPSMTAKQAFEKILSQLDENDPLRLMGEMLLPSIPDNLVAMVAEIGDSVPAYVAETLEDAVGFFMPNVTEGDAPFVVFRGDSYGSDTGLRLSTVIHEFMHVAMYDGITAIQVELDQNPNSDLKQFPPEMVAAYNDLISLQYRVLGDPRFKRLIKSLGKNGEFLVGELQDIHEFITWGLTHPQASEYFRALKYPNSGQTAWSQFLTSVAKFFGFDKKDDTMSAFMMLADASERFIKADFRQDAAEQKRILGYTAGIWYDNTKTNNDDSTEPNREPVKTLERQAIPLKVASFDVNDETGSPAYGLHLKADDFVGDVYQMVETGESQSLMFNDEAISEQLLKMYNEDKAAATLVYAALKEAADFKINSQAPLSAKRLAVQVFLELGGDGLGNKQKYINFINGLDFDNLSVRVAVGPSNVDFYRDQYLLERIDSSGMTEGEKLGLIKNPSKLYDPVVVAKLKIALPDLWKQYTDYLYAETVDPETGDTIGSLDLYEFLANKLGSPQDASELLNGIGIHGMVSDDGTRYVLFDEIKIKQILGREKKVNTINVDLSTGAVIGEVTKNDRQKHSKLIAIVDEAQETLEQMARYGLSETEQQTLTTIMNLLKSSMRAFASKRDNSVSFFKMLEGVRDTLKDAKKLSNMVYSELKAATDPNTGDPFSEVSRMLLKEAVIAQITQLDVYTPLQKRIADILLAGLSDNYTLAGDRAQALIEDLQDGDIASALVSGVRNEYGNVVPVQDFLGGISEVVLQQRDINLQSNVTIRGGSVDQLREDIPNEQRVFGKSLEGGKPITKEDGTRFIDGDLNQPGPGLSGIGLTPEDFQQVWDVAVGASSDTTKRIIETKGTDGPVRPKDYEFWDRALQLADQARYWYEISTESMRETLSELSPAEMEMFFMIVGATSPQANPHDNMRRAISLMGNLAANRPALTAIAKGIGDKGGVVRKAIMGSSVETNKVHNFAGTFLYLAGYTTDAPLSTNDRQVAFSFNMQPTALFANQTVYYTISQFYLGLADALNERLPEGAEPYQAWQLQALGWVQERIDNPQGSDTNDDYMMALERIRQAAVEEGIIPEGGSFSNEVLADERLQDIVDPTTPNYVDANKTTIEVYSERSGATQELEQLREYVDSKKKWSNRITAAIRRSARALLTRDQVNKVPSVPSRLMSALAGKKVEITRMDYGDGTYKGNANLNMRIPLNTPDLQHMKRVVAAFNEGLNQFLSPASNYKTLDAKDPLPEGAIETTQIFVPNAKDVNLEELSNALPMQFEISVSYVPNGVIIDVAPDFDTKGGPYGMQRDEANAFFTEHLRIKDDTSKKDEFVRPTKYGFDLVRSAFTGIYSAKNDEVKDADGNFVRFKTQAEMRNEYNQAKKDAQADAMPKLQALKVGAKPVLRRFLEGSDKLIRDNKNDAKLINSLYNIRNDYSDQMSWDESSQFAVQDAYTGIYADGIDQILEVVPNAKVSEAKSYLQGEGKYPAAWPQSGRKSAKSIYTKINGRIEGFRGAYQKIEAALEQQQQEISDVLEEVKQENGPQILAGISPKLNANLDIIALDEIDALDGVSVSLHERAPSSDAYFERQQLLSELALAEESRDSRTDIAAGREVREIREKLIPVELNLAKAQREPSFEEGSFGDNLDNILGRIIAPSPADKTIRERLNDIRDSWLSREGWSERLKDWYQSGVAAAAAIEALEREVVKRMGLKGPRLEGNKSPTVLTYQAMNASVAASIPIHHNGVKLEHGQLVIDDRIKGLEKILEPIKLQGKKYIRLFEAYLVAQRAERLLAEDKENFVLDTDIQEIMNYVNARPNLKRLFETAATEYAALNRSVLEVAIRSGYINREDAFGGQYAQIIDANGNVVKEIKGPRGTMIPLDVDLDAQMEQMLLDMDKPNLSYKIVQQDGWYHDDYVPFNRVNELSGKTRERGQGGGKVGEVRKGVIGLKGGIGAIPVLENMASNITFLITGSMKTMAMRSIQSYAGELVMEKIETTGEAPLIDAETARTLLEEMNIDIDELSTLEQQRWIRMLSRARPFDNDVVVLYRNGRPEYYRVMDHRLLQSLKNIGPREVHRILDMLGMITRTLTKSITIMPSFLVRNFVRETQNTFIINEKAVNPIRAVFQALLNVAKLARDPAKTKIMYEMMAAGSVSHNNYFDVTPANIRKRLYRTTGDRSAFKRVIGSVADIFRLYYRMAVASEHANRLTVRNDYIKARTKELGGDLSAAQQAMVTAEANHRALDVMNFSRRGGGAIADVAIAVLPFINPRVQGMDRLLRGAKHNKGQFAMKLGTMAMAATALAMWNWEENEEEMKKLKDTDKDLFYHMWFEVNGKKEHFRIPKGFEIGQIAGTFPERVVEEIKNKRSEPIHEVLWRFGATTFGIQIPQPVKPLIEVGMDYDTFRQRPILGFGMQVGKTPPHMRYDVYTSYVMKDIAQNMPDAMPAWLRSPKQLEYLFEGYFGTVGATILEAGNYLYRATGNAPDAPTLDKSQYPIVRDYYRSNLEYSSRAIDVFYDMLTESGKVAAELKTMKEEGDPRYSEFKDSNRQITRARKSLNRTSKRLSTLSKKIKEIYGDPDMDGDLKFLEIQRLQAKRNAIAQQAMEKYWEAFY